MMGRVSLVARLAGMVALGFLGMGLYVAADTLYRDWRFLHQVRVQQEQRVVAPPPPQAPTKPPDADVKP